MKTPKETLHKYINTAYQPGTVTEECAIKAMKEYAEQFFTREDMAKLWAECNGITFSRFCNLDTAEFETFMQLNYPEK